MSVYSYIINESLSVIDESTKINSPKIRKDGKYYKIKLPKEIKEEGEVALKILLDKVRKLQSSSEYKAIVKELRDNKLITSNDSKSKLDDTIVRDIVDYNNNWYFEVGTTSDMSQDMFYSKTTDGKQICTLTDEIYKEIKNDPKIKKLAHFSNFFNADDFYGIYILFKIGDQNSVELELDEK